MTTAHTPQQPPDWREICDQNDYHHNPHEQTWSQIRKGRHRINYTTIFLAFVLVYWAVAIWLGVR